MSQHDNVPILTILLAAPSASADLITSLEDGKSGLRISAVVDDAEHLDRAISQGQPDVVFIHQHLQNTRGSLGSYIQQKYGIPAVLLVDNSLKQETDLLSPHKSPFPAGILVEAHRAGLVEVAGWPASPGELKLVAQLAIRALSNRDVTISNVVTGRHSRVVGFRSGIDGVGTTEMAINTAMHIAHEGHTVALIDMNLAGANVHRKLHLMQPPHTTGLHRFTEHVRDAAAIVSSDANPIEAIDIEPYVSPYPSPDGQSCGSKPSINVLLGIEDRAIIKLFGESTYVVDRLISAVRRNFDVTIIDLGAQQSPAHLQLIAQLDDLVVVTAPTYAELELVASSHTRVLKATGLHQDRCHILVNLMDNPLYQVSLVDIASRFGKSDLLGAIAMDHTLVRRARSKTFPPPILDDTPAAFTSSFRYDMALAIHALLPDLVAEPANHAKPLIVGMIQNITEKLHRLRGKDRLKIQEPNNALHQVVSLEVQS